MPHPAEKKKKQEQTDPLTAFLAANEFNRMSDLPSAQADADADVRYGYDDSTQRGG